MKCQEFQEWLQEYLDGSVEETSDRHFLHLGQCPPCRGLLAAAQSLKQSLRRQQWHSWPVESQQRLVAQVLQDQRSSPAWRRSFFYLTAAALAAGLGWILLARWPGGGQSGGVRPTPSPDTVARSGDQHPPKPGVTLRNSSNSSPFPDRAISGSLP